MSMENTPFPALESSGDPGDWKDVIGTMTLFGHLPVPADTETEMMFKFACKLKEGNDQRGLMLSSIIKAYGSRFKNLGELAEQLADFARMSAAGEPLDYDRIANDANKFAAQNQQMVDLCEKILCSLGERNQREYREGVIALHELHNSVAGTWSGDDDSEATE
jgi:hypothetical protein